jgi:hypothetical protein
MWMLTLWYAGPWGRVSGKDIPFKHDDFPEVVGQNLCGGQSAHSCANDNCSFT